MKLISVVTPCYNEEGNVELVYAKVKAIFEELPAYRYEHIFIDNASQDQTVPILKRLAREDHNVKIIVNNRNFGPLRSPYYGLLQAYGDAVISLVADLQDPPDCIPEFIRRWEQGDKLVIGIKTNSAESGLMFWFRTIYYRFLNKIADIKLLNHATGFGLYDQEVIQGLRELNDCYPDLRALISELGFQASEVHYFQPVRAHGKSKGKFFIMYDWAMLGITSHSKIPLRLAAILGFVLATGSLLMSFFYLIYKLIFWNSFSLGTAPIVIGFFFFSSVQLFFIGILGEYIGAIYTQVLKRPLVTERERINFDDSVPKPAFAGTISTY